MTLKQSQEKARELSFTETNENGRTVLLTDVNQIIKKVYEDIVHEVESNLELIMKIDIGDASPTRLALQKYLDDILNKLKRDI